MITVVQAVFYGGDKAIKKIVNQPSFEGVEYKLLTNKPELAYSTNWDVILTETENPRLKAREAKINIHTLFPKSDYWFWIDANMKIVEDPNILVKKYLNNFDICLLPHPERTHWVEEANFLVNRDHQLKPYLEKAIKKYTADGFPSISLFETGVLLRRNTAKIKHLNEIWMNEIHHTCIRDQISFPYSAWKAGVAVNTFPGTNSVNRLRYESKPYLPQWTEVIRDWN